MKRSPFIKFFKKSKSSPDVQRSSGKLFGGSIGTICGNGTLPKSILGMLSTLYFDGPSTVGIFRIGASQRQCRKLQTSLSNGIELDDFPLLVTGSTFKLFLRSLKDCVLQSSLFDQWMEVCDKQVTDQKINMVKKLVENLPECNVTLLKHIICMLHHISDNSAVNQMTYENLGICFGQSLLWPPSKDDLNLQTRAIYKVSNIVGCMIEHCEQIFGSGITHLFDDIPHTATASSNVKTTDSSTDDNGATQGASQVCNRSENRDIDNVPFNTGLTIVNNSHINDIFPDKDQPLREGGSKRKCSHSEIDPLMVCTESQQLGVTHACQTNDNADGHDPNISSDAHQPVPPPRKVRQKSSSLCESSFCVDYDQPNQEIRVPVECDVFKQLPKENNGDNKSKTNVPASHYEDHDLWKSPDKLLTDAGPHNAQSPPVNNELEKSGVYQTPDMLRTRGNAAKTRALSNEKISIDIPDNCPVRYTENRSKSMLQSPESESLFKKNIPIERISSLDDSFMPKVKIERGKSCNRSASMCELTSSKLNDHPDHNMLKKVRAGMTEKGYDLYPKHMRKIMRHSLKDDRNKNADNSGKPHAVRKMVNLECFSKSPAMDKSNTIKMEVQHTGLNDKDFSSPVSHSPRSTSSGKDAHLSRLGISVNDVEQQKQKSCKAAQLYQQSMKMYEQRADPGSPVSDCSEDQEKICLKQSNIVLSDETHVLAKALDSTDSLDCKLFNQQSKEIPSFTVISQSHKKGLESQYEDPIVNEPADKLLPELKTLKENIYNQIPHFDGHNEKLDMSNKINTERDLKSDQRKVLLNTENNALRDVGCQKLSVRNRSWHKELAEQYTKSSAPSDVDVKVKPAVRYAYSNNGDIDYFDSKQQSKRKGWQRPVHPTKDLVVLNNKNEYRKPYNNSSSKQYGVESVKGLIGESKAKVSPDYARPKTLSSNASHVNRLVQAYGKSNIGHFCAPKYHLSESAAT